MRARADRTRLPHLEDGGHERLVRIRVRQHHGWLGAEGPLRLWHRHPIDIRGWRAPWISMSWRPTPEGWNTDISIDLAALLAEKDAASAWAAE